MYRCEDIPALISAELDGALTPEESRQLSAHLQSCGACTALAREMRTLHEEMSGLAEEAPDGLADAVMAQIRQENGRTPAVSPSRKRRRIRWKLWGGLAAALVLALLGAGRLLLPGISDFAASGGTAAAPAPLGSTAAPEAAASSGAKDFAAADGAPADSPVPDTSDMTRAGIIAGKNAAADEPSPEFGGTADAGDTGAGKEEAASFSAAMQAPDGTVTPLDAGRLVLEAIGLDDAGQYEPEAGSDSLIFVFQAENGGTSRLAYTGMSGDGSRYEFTLTAPDGSEQYWSAAADGSSVAQIYK